MIYERGILSDITV